MFLLLLNWILAFSPAAFEEIFFPPAFQTGDPRAFFAACFTTLCSFSGANKFLNLLPSHYNRLCVVIIGLATAICGLLKKKKGRKMFDRLMSSSLAVIQCRDCLVKGQRQLWQLKCCNFCLITQGFMNLRLYLIDLEWCLLKNVLRSV